MEEIGAALPKGIKLQHDGRYRAVLSLRVKNYLWVRMTAGSSFAEALLAPGGAAGLCGPENGRS